VAVDNVGTDDSIQWIEVFLDFDSTQITFPVVTVNVAQANIVNAALKLYGGLNITIDAVADYNFDKAKNSGVYHALSVVLVTWSAVNIALGCFILRTFRLKKSIASVCICFELLADLCM
jgi:hypothetical protein